MNVLSRLWVKIVRYIIPKKTKRMIVLTSLSSTILNRISIEDQNTYLTQLNSALHLANKEEAMRFAVELGRFIWKDVSIRYRDMASNYDTLVEEILSNCPESLQYDDKVQMRKDICEAISFMHQNLPA